MASQPIAAKIVQSVLQVDAEKNWVDVLMTTDQGRVLHKWYRPGAGWQGPEEITAAI